eukprot:6183648-Pleurochrysis_carterae.AAC.2
METGLASAACCAAEEAAAEAAAVPLSKGETFCADTTERGAVCEDETASEPRSWRGAVSAAEPAVLAAVDAFVIAVAAVAPAASATVGVVAAADNPASAGLVQSKAEPAGVDSAAVTAAPAPVRVDVAPVAFPFPCAPPASAVRAVSALTAVDAAAAPPTPGFIRGAGEGRTSSSMSLSVVPSSARCGQKVVFLSGTGWFDRT